MAPGLIQASLERRDYYCDYYGNCGYSTWNTWGRWVALAVILVVAFLLMFGLSSRRRRRRGMAPMYGTGWMAPNSHPQYGQQAPGYYANNDVNYAAAAPPYSPPVKNNVTGDTFTGGEGYYGQNNYASSNPYGGQQSGIELQAPQSSYQPARGGDVVYDAPPGPPPAKGDGIIR